MCLAEPSKTSRGLLWRGRGSTSSTSSPPLNTLEEWPAECSAHNALCGPAADGRGWARVEARVQQALGRRMRRRGRRRAGDGGLRDYTVWPESAPAQHLSLAGLAGNTTWHGEPIPRGKERRQYTHLTRSIADRKVVRNRKLAPYLERRLRSNSQLDKFSRSRRFLLGSGRLSVSFLVRRIAAAK